LYNLIKLYHMSRKMLPGPTYLPHQPPVSIPNLPQDKLLLVVTLGNEDAVLDNETEEEDENGDGSSSLINDPKSLEEVMAIIKPTQKITLDSGDGLVTETFVFQKSTAAFEPDNLKKQSRMLQELAEEEAVCNIFVIELENNARLQKLLNDPSKKAELMAYLDGIEAELEESLL
jgi:hypothetical protein